MISISWLQTTSYYIQCAYETQQQIACAQLLKSTKYHIQLTNKYLSTPDFTAIGYVTNTTVLSTMLSLTNCDYWYWCCWCHTDDMVCDVYILTPQEESTSLNRGSLLSINSKMKPNEVKVVCAKSSNNTSYCIPGQSWASFIRIKNCHEQSC